MTAKAAAYYNKELEEEARPLPTPSRPSTVSTPRLQAILASVSRPMPLSVHSPRPLHSAASSANDSTTTPAILDPAGSTLTPTALDPLKPVPSLSYDPLNPAELMRELATPDHVRKVQPIKRKYTPKAATLYNIKEPGALKKAKGLQPASDVTPSIVEEIPASPMDFLLALVDQAIPVEEPTVDENAAPTLAEENDNIDEIDQKMLRRILKVQKERQAGQTPKRVYRRKLITMPLLTESIAPSPATVASPLVAAPQNVASTASTSPILTAILQKKSPLMTYGEGRKRMAPIKHADSICSNCNTTETTLWRRSGDNGEIECNSCSLYFKKKGHRRPLELAHRRIHKRNRKSGGLVMREEGFDVEKVIEAISPMPRRPSDKGEDKSTMIMNGKTIPAFPIY